MSGVPARDYIFQTEPYEEQIKKAAKLIREADYILFGLGAGMSTAAGAQYGGDFFKQNFGEFIEKYGAGHYMQDMYSAGFYPYPDEESYWGYWSRQAIVGGIDLDVTGLYRQLIVLAQGKKIVLPEHKCRWSDGKSRLPGGTGFNTPMIIRFPFEKMVREHRQCAMVRLNLNEAVVQESCAEREVGINADMAKSIPDILKEIK